MTQVDGGTELFQTVRDCRCTDVRTRHLVAEIQQHLCNTAHTDPADPDEMNVLDPLKHRLSYASSFNRPLYKVHNPLFRIQNRYTTRVRFNFTQPLRMPDQ